MIGRALVIAILAVLPGFAQERIYTISLDGKAAGEAALTLESGKDESTTLKSRFKLTRDVAIPRFSETTEDWRAGRLVRLESTGRLTLVAGKDGYALKAGVKEVTIRGEVWPSSYWLKPAADKPLIVDAPTGEVCHAKIEKIGPDRVKGLATAHYRVMVGGTPTDLWYDAKDRLVKRTWSRDGHAFVLELKAD